MFLYLTWLFKKYSHALIFPTIPSLPTQRRIFSPCLSRSLRQETMWPHLTLSCLTSGFFSSSSGHLSSVLFTQSSSPPCVQALWEALFIFHSMDSPQLLPSTLCTANSQSELQVNLPQSSSTCVHWTSPPTGDRGIPDPTGAEMRSLTYIYPYTQSKPCLAKGKMEAKRIYFVLLLLWLSMSYTTKDKMHSAPWNRQR